MDDEYFVRMISMNRKVGDSPAAAFAREAVQRSFTKPNKIGFTRALLQSMNEIPIFSPAGVYCGHAASYDVDLERLCNVIERTMRGLYFHEFKVRVPDDKKCVIYALDGFAAADIDTTARISKIWQHALSGQKRTFGDNVFVYWFQALDSASTTLWAFVIYGCVGFIAFTRPQAKNTEEKALPGEERT